jgi:hypothetical protein
VNLEVQGLRWLRSQSANGLLAGAYTTLGGMALHAGPGRVQQWCLVGLGAVALLAWAAALRRARAIADIATSRIASAAQGYVELQGRATTDHLITSPLTNTPCVWYRYRIYARDSDDKEWQEVQSGTSDTTFDITDNTGQCTVDPDHAEVIGAEVTTRVRNDHKHVEELLHAGRLLYVLGEFRTEGGASSTLSLRDDVGALLNTWKQDPATLHRKFDLNRDGEIDLKEWELARRLATRMVEQEHRAIRQQPGVHVLRAPQDGRLFLLSPLSPQSLRRRYLLWSALHLSAALAVLVVWVRYLR